jgi:hypothetical protein
VSENRVLRGNMEPGCGKAPEAGGKCVMKSIRICTFPDYDGIETEKGEKGSACSKHRR